MLTTICFHSGDGGGRPGRATCAQVGICGKRLAQADENDAICCAASRFFKYLVPLYAEEFAHKLKQLVVSRLQMAPDGARTPPPEVELFQDLYGRDVIPESVSNILNVSLGTWTHVAAHGETIASTRGQLFAALYKAILVANEKPVVTRFWTFGICVRTFMLMRLLGIPKELFDLSTTSPAPDNARRLQGFCSWYGNASSDSALRVACMNLALTDIALNVTAKKNDEHATSMGVDPPLVRLSRGDVQRMTTERLQLILKKMRHDSRVDALAAMFSLFKTQAHIVARFGVYAGYPTKVWRMTKKFNASGYLSAVGDFLDAADDQLDYGYSLPLRREAMRTGGADAATLFLLSEDGGYWDVDYGVGGWVASGMAYVLLSTASYSLTPTPKPQHQNNPWL